MKKIFILTIIFLLLCPVLNSCVSKDNITDIVANITETESVDLTTEFTEPVESYDIRAGRRILFLKMKFQSVFKN